MCLLSPNFPKCTSRVFLLFFSPLARQPLWARRSSLSRFQVHRRTEWVEPLGRLLDPSQGPLPDNTQHSQETDIHGPGRIQTNKCSNRAAADHRGHWGLRELIVRFKNSWNLMETWYLGSEEPDRGMGGRWNELHEAKSSLRRH
jgi:hypothetical protein